MSGVTCRTSIITIVCASITHPGSSASTLRTTWEVTAQSALRAAKLGGVHIHRLFGFVPPKNKRWVSASAMAATGLRRLARMPCRRRFLQELRVLVIDEMAQVPMSACLSDPYHQHRASPNCPLTHTMSYR